MKEKFYMQYWGRWLERHSQMFLVRTTVALNASTQLVYLTNKCESIKGNLLLPVIQTLSFSLSPKILTKSNVVKDTFAGSEAWELFVLAILPALLFTPETAVEFSLADDSPNAVFGRWTRGDAEMSKSTAKHYTSYII